MPDDATFNPARRLATRVLAQVLGGDRYASAALDEALSRARLSAPDAGLATHVVYGTLRHHPRLDAALKPLLRGPTQPKVRALLLAGAYEKLVLQTPAHAVVNEYVGLARQEYGKLSGLVNAVLRRVELPEPDERTEFNLPPWLIQEFRSAYTDHAEDVMRDFLLPAPLWLWLSEAGVRSLEAEGALVEPGFADVFRVTLPRPLRATGAYRQGQAQPINPASFAVVESLGKVSDRRVLDLAGGAGVKAAMLALRGARVLSVDIDARKHRAAQENFRRLGVQAEQLVQDLRLPLAVEGAELVLLDAPCTGTGTLRAHPEIKLRIQPGSIQELAALQRQLLDTAANAVAPGGTLVYSVCSIASAEGPQLVEAFLRDRPEFRSEAAPVSVPVLNDAHGSRTLATQGLDGFYVSVLRRR